MNKSGFARISIFLDKWKWGASKWPFPIMANNFKSLVNSLKAQSFFSKKWINEWMDVLRNWPSGLNLFIFSYFRGNLRGSMEQQKVPLKREQSKWVVVEREKEFQGSEWVRMGWGRGYWPWMGWIGMEWPMSVKLNGVGMRVPRPECENSLFPPDKSAHSPFPFFKLPNCLLLSFQCFLSLIANLRFDEVRRKSHVRQIPLIFDIFGH